MINTDLANYDGNYSFNDSPKGKCRKETTDVGSFPANSWGLYDVHGNVWEWCRDAKRTYTAADHTDADEQSSDYTYVLRGGSWRYSPGHCRAAYRSRNSAAYCGCNCGFRVCFRPGLLTDLPVLDLVLDSLSFAIFVSRSGNRAGVDPASTKTLPSL